MLTVLEFHTSSSQSVSPRGGISSVVHNRSRNQLLSHTLQKVTFLDDKVQYREMPKDGELWLCDVVREIVRTDFRRGAFISRPVRQVQPSEINPLSLGMYELALSRNRCLIIKPTREGLWSLSKRARSNLVASYNASAAILDFGGEPWRELDPPATRVTSDLYSIVDQKKLSSSETEASVEDQSEEDV